MRHATIDTNFSLRVEAQTHPLSSRLEPMLDIRIQAGRIESTKQCLAGEVTPRFVDATELFATTKGTSRGRQTINETKAFTRPDQGLIQPGRHRRIEHDHPAIKLRALQGGVIVQHSTKRMTDSPDWLLQRR